MRLKITVPATSANLGPGFDSLGIALSLYNETVVEEHEGIDIAATDGTNPPRDRRNLIYRTCEDLFRACGRTLPGLKLRQKNGIPFTSGLGSSSACIVTGLLAGNALLGEPLCAAELIDYAARLEGHPDNSTPALCGGFVASVMSDGHVSCIKKEIEPDLAFAAFVPAFSLSTKKARACLPAKIDHRDAVFNLSRASLLSLSLFLGRYDNLKVATEDCLHQPYRLGLIPGGEEIIRYCVGEGGAYGAFVSGAGPTILAMIPSGDTDFMSHAKDFLLCSELTDYTVTPLRADNAGASVELLDRP